MCDRDWTGAWQSGGILRTGSAWILYEKCGCESGWYESSEDYMYSLCAVWYYGCHGWLTARTWVFRDADDRISDWCVRTPTVVDIYIFRIYERFHTPQSLYLTYPVSWIITICAHVVCFVIVRRRISRRLKTQSMAQ